MRSAKGTVYKLDDGRWRVMVEAGRDPKTGKRVRMTKTVRGSRKKAEGVKAAMLVEVGDPEQAREDMTLDQFFHALYRPHCEKTVRERTLSGYDDKYETFVRKPLGGMRLSRVKPPVIRRWLDGIEGDKRKVQAYKIVRQMMNYAVKMDLLETSPMTHVEPPKNERYRFETLTADQARAYLEHFRRPEIDRNAEKAVLLALGDGLTRSEMIGLDWDDIDAEGTVTVGSGVTQYHGKVTRGKPKNEFRVRRVHSPASIAERLNELRGEGPVFADEDGNPLKPDMVSGRYATALSKLPPDVPRIKLKDLRHTSLTLALESGVDLLVVSRRAGHSSPNTTANYYLRPHEQVDVEAAEKLDKML